MNIETFVVGYGAIGKELVRQIRHYGWNVRYVGKSDGIHTLDSNGKLTRLQDELHVNALYEPNVDLSRITIAFLTTPPSLNGMIAKDYAVSFFQMESSRMKRRIPIVCCDKSLFAYHPCYLSSVGSLAAVGGGSHILPFLKQQVRGRRDVRAHLVLNATLNFIMSEECSIEEAVIRARALHLAEPGAVDCLAIVNNEINDTVLKTCIVANLCFLEEPKWSLGKPFVFYPRCVQVKHLNPPDLKQLEAQKGNYRYVVSFSAKSFGAEAVIGGFDFQSPDGWFIRAGFRRVDDNRQFTHLLLPGSSNGVVVHSDDGEAPPCCLTGPGAGPVPTARAMLQDAKRTLGLR